FNHRILCHLRTVAHGGNGILSATGDLKVIAFVFLNQLFLKFESRVADLIPHVASWLVLPFSAAGLIALYMPMLAAF
ncbi:hypothetical protein ACTXQV_75150, partial [Klebsiella pneumoniae]